MNLSRPTQAHRPGFYASVLLLAFCIALSGCGEVSPTAASQKEDNAADLTSVSLQTDWFAQPEHGGFYEAKAAGFYEEAGLEVSIREGGPNAMPLQRLSRGDTDFVLASSDDIIMLRSRGRAVKIVGVSMQHSPLAVMLHAENSVETISDLDGLRVMAAPSLTWIPVMQALHGIDFEVIAPNYGLESFLADKSFIQQAYITNEPFFVRKRGADPKTLPLSDYGYDAYRVIATTDAMIAEQPELVQAFVTASTRGWDSYLKGPGDAANQEISRRNPSMTEDFIAYARKTLKERSLVTGKPEQGGGLGVVDPERIQGQINQLGDLGLLRELVKLEEVLDLSFFPQAQTPMPVTETQAQLSAGGPQPQRTPTTPQRTPTTPQRALEPLTKKPDGLFLELRGDGLGLGIGQALYLTYDQIRRLPIIEIEHETTVRPGEISRIEGVTLADLMEALALPPSVDYVLADCEDRYQANYTAEVIENNRPFLILSIDGDGPEVWTLKNGRPRYGPFALALSESGGLLDPMSKEAVGVWRLRFTDYQSRTEPFYSEKLARLSGEAIRGREIYLSSCITCHSWDPRTSYGGDKSTVTTRILGIQARSQPAYLRGVVRDPQKFLGSQDMTAFPHYSDADLDALIAFLSEVR